MKVLILGSGLLGVTTAYELGKRGFDVTVLERNSESARETSFANGGQLSYTHAEPWASPGSLAKLPKWLGRADAPLQFKLRADWQMIRWGLKFLRNCTPDRANINCVSMLRLGLYSRQRMEILRKESGIGFDFGSKGILHIYGTDADFDHAKKQLDFQARFGSNQTILGRDDVYTLEPALAHSSRTLVGGIHSVEDETGDPYIYCNALAGVAAERYGVKFKYGVTINEIRTEGKTVTAIRTSEGDISADSYVMAMGSYSSPILRDIGIDVPIYPMKGYSITIEANEGCPDISLTDGSHKIVYSRLGNRLRVAGTAEFAGYDQSLNEKRIAPIVRAAAALFPRADWSQPISKWACIRPSTPDGPPILGNTPYRNLFLNTGHGTLGWTQAAGSAAIVADAMEGRPPAIIMQGLPLERYVP
jgi:D-amino-acid dehydrogenase